MLNIPNNTRVLVIGGGPAGSTAAGLLARQGLEVTLLEQDLFPRYHIGESLLPSILQIMDLLGAREKMDKFGHQRKLGAYLEWGREDWPLNFGELGGEHTYAFQVVRSEFDQFLMDHAASLGAKVFQGVEVRSLNFDNNGRPFCAQWQQKMGKDELPGESGEIAFDYLIDASGRWGVMSNHYLRNRRYHKVFQNVAIWGYWENADRMVTGREGDIAVSSIPHGWLWAIPLREGKMSVGVVLHRDAVNAQKDLGLEGIYHKAIADSKMVKKVVSSATMTSGVLNEADYSYTAEQFSGPGYFMCGDAACFLDPLLSSGVHLATFSAMLAVASITSLVKGEITEGEAMSFFEKSYRQAYLRFLVFLSAFYDVNRGRESYFSEAQRLTQEDVDASTLKTAFLSLVTGLKDLSDAQKDTHNMILEEMAKRINENLNFRKDKDTLATLEGEKLAQARANANFFSSIEGIFSLNRAEAIDGLYIDTEPTLRVARA